MATSRQTAARVTVPDTKLARETTELVRESTTDLVYDHSRRVFWFGSLQGRNRGLGAAIAVELDVGAIGRLPEPVEVAAYYVCSEALTNATRHAHASVVRVAVEKRDDRLHLSVRDDGVGGVDPACGSGLIGLRDRVEALGGSFEVSGPRGEGALIDVQLPL